MKALFYLLIPGLFVSCGKNPPTPPSSEMRYIDLQNVEMRFGQSKGIDVTEDGVVDFYFYTLLVGDPVLERDRLQFYAGSKLETYLLNDVNDQTPLLNKGATISAQHSGYEWYNASSIVLAEKIVPMIGQPFWEGAWKTASHAYLALQVRDQGKVYFGWVEISFDATSEKLVLHKAAMHKKENVGVKAGY